MSQLTLIFATWFQPEWSRAVASWQSRFPVPALLIPSMSILPAYQLAYESTTSEIIGYLHDDLICYDDNWLPRILHEFADPSVALVGVAGAPGHCHLGLSPTEFNPMAMGRIGFRSNLRNAEAHGARFTGASNATVLDGMALFIRRSALTAIGGWPVSTPISYFMYTEYLCCSLRRLGHRIRIVGLDVDHLGGRSTGLNPNLNPDWLGEHKFLYDEFIKDGTIPAMVEP